MLDGKYIYYENGKKVSEADEKVGKFIAENFIENVKFEKENNEYNYNSFTGMQVVDSFGVLLNTALQMKINLNKQ